MKLSSLFPRLRKDATPVTTQPKQLTPEEERAFIQRVMAKTAK